MLTGRYDEAFRYAHELHSNQKRKGTSIPYISHLMIVSALVIENGGTEDQAIGALLHDAAEDQGGRETLEEIRNRFGDEVAEIVSDCTDSWTEEKPDWQPRKEVYLATLPAKPSRSLLVSLADKTHNAEAILFDYRNQPSRFASITATAAARASRAATSSLRSLCCAPVSWRSSN